MDNKINYQHRLIEMLRLENESGRTPSILLHACCAPCSSACLEVLDRYACVTVFFCNPNITIREEYDYRLSELKRLVAQMPFQHRIEVEEGVCEPEAFFKMARGLENEPERGKRCHGCYRLRLQKTLERFAMGGFDLFATTLTLSPLKPAQVINEIGLELSDRYLPSDFKKNNGYLRSIELSKEYGLYRQNYCGCIYSKQAQ